MEEVVDLLLLGIAVLALIFASVTDIKKQEVPNWLHYSLLAAALAIRGIASLLFWELSYFYWALIAVAIFYILGEFFYYGKVFGGGDTGLFVALAAVFATRPYFVKTTILGEPFLMTFLINAIFLGAIWSIFMIIYSFIKFKPKKKFFKQIHKKLVAPNKLAEGDSLTENIKIGKTIIKKSAYGLTKEQIKLLIKHKKKIWIMKAYVFVPVILLALVVSLFYGNLLFNLIYNLIG